MNSISAAVVTAWPLGSQAVTPAGSPALLPNPRYRHKQRTIHPTAIGEIAPYHCLQHAFSMRKGQRETNINCPTLWGIEGESSQQPLLVLGQDGLCCSKREVPGEICPTGSTLLRPLLYPCPYRQHLPESGCSTALRASLQGKQGLRAAACSLAFPPSPPTAGLPGSNPALLAKRGSHAPCTPTCKPIVNLQNDNAAALQPCNQSGDCLTANPIQVIPALLLARGRLKRE